MPIYRNAALAETKQLVTSVPSKVELLECSSGTNPGYLQLFDADDTDDVTVGTTAPKYSFYVSADGIHVPYGSEVQLKFELGIVAAYTATAEGSGAPTTAANINLETQRKFNDR